MSDWAWVGLGCASYFALVMGFAGMSAWMHRRYSHNHENLSVVQFSCVICDRPVPDPTKVTCSEVCVDVWLGELGAKQ